MAKYKKVENCGPVPHPDQSGKFLVDGETAEGDAWEPLVALGFVVKVAEEAPAKAKAAPPEEVKAAPPEEEPKPVILKDETEEDSDVVPTNDGAAAEAMDSSETGKPSDEGLSGRAPARRRR